VAKGATLAPGAPDDPLQWIDVRDLAEWLVTMVEHDTVGEFNGVGPAKPGRWGDVLQTCVDASKGGAKLAWVPHKFLAENEMGEDGAFPIWTAPVGKYAGFHRWSNERAKATGLSFRTTADTVKAINEWYPKEIERRVRVTKELAEAAKAKGKPEPKGDPTALRAGPPADKEQALLAKWKARPQ
jgi:2'-hydroxyisoflavone reductase